MNGGFPLDSKTLTDLQALQATAFNATIATTKEGDVIKAKKYCQIFFADAVKQADGSLVWCDVYDGPLGCGYIIRELSADGKQTKATDYGPEKRSIAWTKTPVAPDKLNGG